MLADGITPIRAKKCKILYKELEGLRLIIKIVYIRIGLKPFPAILGLCEEFISKFSLNYDAI